MRGLGVICAALWATCGPLVSVTSSVPRIGIAFDDACTGCSVTATQGTPLSLFIVLQGWSRSNQGLGEMAEASFTVRGIPADWAVSYEPSPLASFASDPFHPLGATIQFPAGFNAVPDCLVLYRCTLVPGSTAGRRVWIDDHSRRKCSDDYYPPTRPGPLVVTCYGGHTNSAILCTGHCEPGGQSTLDGRPCSTTSITASVWSQVKSLYRDATR